MEPPQPLLTLPPSASPACPRQHEADLKVLEEGICLGFAQPPQKQDESDLKVLEEGTCLGFAQPPPKQDEADLKVLEEGISLGFAQLPPKQNEADLKVLKEGICTASCKTGWSRPQGLTGRCNCWVLQFSSGKLKPTSRSWRQASFLWLCVCACVRACVRTYVRACARARVCCVCVLLFFVFFFMLRGSATYPRSDPVRQHVKIQLRTHHYIRPRLQTTAAEWLDRTGRKLPPVASGLRRDLPSTARRKRQTPVWHLARGVQKTATSAAWTLGPLAHTDDGAPSPRPVQSVASITDIIVARFAGYSHGMLMLAAYARGGPSSDMTVCMYS